MNVNHRGFEDLLAKIKDDQNVLGFFLGGSRGKGYENDNSDYDVHLIVKDEVAEEYKERYKEDIPDIDLSVSSITEFRSYAKWQTETHWDRYDFTHVKTIIDRTGEIQKLIDEKGSIPRENKEAYIKGQLDAYINGFFRSIKAHKKNTKIGQILEANNSISYLLSFLFALHDRATPFANYLERELSAHPLHKLPINSEDFLSLLAQISAGDIKAQQKLARIIESVTTKEGLHDVIEGWEGKFELMLEYED